MTASSGDEQAEDRESARPATFLDMFVAMDSALRNPTRAGSNARPADRSTTECVELRDAGEATPRSTPCL